MPGSTNFLPFFTVNPLTNIESDSTFLADTMRTGGIPQGTIMVSPLANKIFYQWGLFVAAFCNMLANKGYSPVDGSGGNPATALTNLETVLANVKTGADFPSSLQVVPFATSVTFDMSQAGQFELVLTGNVSSSSIANATLGAQIRLFIQQDATGSRTFSWPSGLTFTPPISPTPNVTTWVTAVILQVSPLIAFVVDAGWNTPSGLTLPPNNNVVAISATGTVSSQYAEITEVVNASAGTLTRTLYQGNSSLKGFKVNIKKDPINDLTTNQININAATGQTIDGFSNGTVFINQPYTSFTLEFDGGSNWLFI